MIVWVTASVVRALHDIALELAGIRVAQERIAAALEKQPDKTPASIQWHVGTPREER